MAAGRTAESADRVGACGHHMGTFRRPFLDIPPTGHAAALRFHEFFWIRDGRVVEVQALWDIPEPMMEFNKARVGFSPETGEALA
mgnify:FL=1